MNILALFISAMLINNIVLTKFLGMCPFMGVSTHLDSAIGMGAAVIFVIFGASVLLLVLLRISSIKSGIYAVNYIHSIDCSFRTVRRIIRKEILTCSL